MTSEKVHTSKKSALSQEVPLKYSYFSDARACTWKRSYLISAVTTVLLPFPRILLSQLFPFLSLHYFLLSQLFSSAAIDSTVRAFAVGFA
jgi:hypothetical protein